MADNKHWFWQFGTRYYMPANATGWLVLLGGLTGAIGGIMLAVMMLADLRWWAVILFAAVSIASAVFLGWAWNNRSQMHPDQSKYDNWTDGY